MLMAAVQLKSIMSLTPLMQLMQLMWLMQRMPLSLTKSTADLPGLALRPAFVRPPFTMRPASALM